MKLDILIEKKEDDISIPIGELDTFQFRSDGIMLKGDLHIWEEILTVQITNRELLDKIKKAKQCKDNINGYCKDMGFKCPHNENIDGFKKVTCRQFRPKEANV